MEPEHVLIKGARQHNLRIPQLEVPKKKLVVLTGVSGSGKSSLAFDTLYAEGQRRYVESLSSYARQFLGGMDKPQVDQIRGLSPTIAVEQKSASSNPRSTVGTITEIHDYLRVLYARIGTQHCPSCGEPVRGLGVDEITGELRRHRGPLVLLAPSVTHRKGEFRSLLDGMRERGFVRVRIDGVIGRLDGDFALDRRRKHTIELVIDRLDPSRVEPSRLADSIESALREGEGTLLALDTEKDTVRRMSRHRVCLGCNLALPELSPQSFSFNSPLGMCPACNGLGRRTAMDPERVIPDPDRSIREGAIVPWAATMQREAGLGFGMFHALHEHFGVDLDKPWRRLPKAHRELVLYGAGDERVKVRWRGTHGSMSWAMKFEGVLNTLFRRYRETKSEAMREHYQQYFSEAACPDCGGARLRAESRAVKVAGATLPDISNLPVSRLVETLRAMTLEGAQATIAVEPLREILARLDFLRSVGLDYLSLSRPGPSLSGGEAQRIRLASQLGAELSGVMYVLDEPSIGLHPRDTDRLLGTLRGLRDLGNSVLVVEHDRSTIEGADHVIDFGPGAGELGGQVVFSGTPSALARARTLTGDYLAGRLRIETPTRRRASGATLQVLGASENNLKHLDVAFPLGTLIAVTGVSGAGKSSLVSDILFPALCRRLHASRDRVGAHRAIVGIEQIDKAIHIDQAPIGRTPRSNPATYTKAFDLIRDIFAQLPDSRAAGFAAGRFSFNVPGGRCEACEGDGVKRVEMHFLPDVYVQCELCRGRRYNETTLAIRYRGRSIADVLALTVREAAELFGAHPKLGRVLGTLAEVGLSYVRLGQPAPTLSGGEAQRVKLSRELARRDTGRTLYLLDEPTTGLHFDDIRKLIHVLNRLVDAGNTVVVVEHNLDVVRSADHVIDLGPEGGAEGGHLVATGTPEQVAAVAASHTGVSLRAVLRPARSPAGRASRRRPT